MYENLAIFAAFVFLYSAVAGGMERTPFSGAIVFAACGLIFGPLGFGLITLNIDAEGLRTLAELTLALVLFTDAANANLGVLGKNLGLPRRLLLVGLPLTIALGYLFGVLLFDDLSIFEIALVATMLAPTDAALGKAVVTNEAVPTDVRESLNVESGLNDGICVPILFVFLALATDTIEGETSTLALKLVAEEIGIGVAVGIGLTLAASWLLRHCTDRGWVTDTWRQLPVVALAAACFALTQFLGGSGFIACFAGGMLFGSLTKHHKHKLLLAAEGTGDTLALITWVIFGAAVVGQSLNSFTWQVVVYALLSLTIIRMLPVFLVLTGTGLRSDEKLFMGWFGPRGLASIVFGVIVLDEHLPGGGTITMTVVCTILFSVIGHGLSANPLVAALAARIRGSALAGTVAGR
ncbi:MAG: cation:proton antiporter [Gammaproteobacteria bacterium]